MSKQGRHRHPSGERAKRVKNVKNDNSNYVGNRRNGGCLTAMLILPISLPFYLLRKMVNNAKD